MGYTLLQVLCDLRYYVSLGRTEQAGVLAADYRGPYYTEVRTALEHGPLPPIRIPDDILCMVGMIYCVPEFAARAHYIKDPELALELSKALELFYNRGYL